MPFTPSHAIAAVPLARLGGGRLPAAALVIGTVVPDLPYFVPTPFSSTWTHAASGPVTVDLVAGLALYVVWRLFRAPVVALLPPSIGCRLPPPRGLSLRTLSPRTALTVAVAVVLGAVTHVVWDTFTHARRWGTTHVASLSDTLGPIPVYKWLQYGSGAFGLAALAGWGASWVARTPRRRLDDRTSPGFRRTVWIGLALVLLIGGGVVGVSSLSTGATLEAAAVWAVTRAGVAAVLAVVVACVLWWARSGGDRSGESPPHGGQA